MTRKPDPPPEKPEIPWVPPIIMQLAERRHPDLAVPYRGSDSSAMRARSGSVDSSDPLVCFFYLLGRDALSLGQIEDLVARCNTELGAERCEYSNGWLARWAEDLVVRLRRTT